MLDPSIRWGLILLSKKNFFFVCPTRQSVVTMPSQSRRSQNLCLARAVEASGVLAERITEFEQ
jgi:hypothetical protein